MTLTLPETLEGFIEDEVASGRFRSSEDALIAALEHFRQQQAKWSALRDDLQKGLDDLDSGTVVEFDASDIKARALARWAAAGKRP